MLKSEGLVVNRKRTYRLYKALGMQVRTKRRKKLARPRIPMAVPTQVNERWSLDFVHDQLTDGRRIRILNIVDDYSRTCVGQLVDTSISGLRVARCLDELANSRGLPGSIVMHNVLRRESMILCRRTSVVPVWRRHSGLTRTDVGGFHRPRDCSRP